MLKLLILQGYVFGFFPFKFEKSSKSVVEFKIIKVFNHFLFFGFSCCLTFVFFKSLNKIMKDYEDPKKCVDAIGEVVVLSFVVLSYGVISLKCKSITSLLNEILKVSLIELKSQKNLKTISGFVVFFIFIIQPLTFCYIIFMLLLRMFTLVTLDLLLLFSLLFVYSARLIEIMFCILSKFLSILMEKVLESEQKSSKVRKILEVMNLVSVFCKTFDSYVMIFIFVEFFFVLSITFAYFSLLIAFTRNELDKSAVTAVILFYSAIILIELSNLILVIGSCKRLKKNASYHRFVSL